MYAGLLLAIGVVSGPAVTVTGASGSGGNSATISRAVVTVENDAGNAPLVYGGVQTNSLSAGLTINLIENPDLAANAAASAAFRRAADRWEAVLADPVTINIRAGLEALTQSDGVTPNTNVIGSASSEVLFGSYATFRSAMVNDEAAEVGRVEPVVGHLPVSSPFFFVPVDVPYDPGDGSTGLANFNIPAISATKANLKALGFNAADLDNLAGTIDDAVITFNSNFMFDFDNSDGVTPGAVDFETVALHEIGHALGFTSEVDNLDALIGTDFDLFRDGDGNIEDDAGDLINDLVVGLTPTTLDLFRFPSNAAENPDDAAEFANFVRTLFLNDPAVSEFLSGEFAMSTGVFFGDGRQASHWKDNNLTGNFIGVMDPTLSNGEAWDFTAADLLALDAIGWDVVPEPSALTVFGVAALLALRRRTT